MELDTFNYLRLSNKKAREKILEIKNDFHLVDPWRQLHPDTKSYTWRQPTPLKQSRLDYFLMSSDIFSLVRKCEIGFGYRTDHSMISLDIVLDKCHKRFTY